MSEILPDWLNPSDDSASPSIEEKHLKVLRNLLRPDHLREANWHQSVWDFARMTREALEAERALVALFHPETSRWSAITSAGTEVGDVEISDHGSRSILEAVRRTRQPILEAGFEPLQVESHSIRTHEVSSVLAVPIQFRDLSGQQADPWVGGCLYAHRTTHQPSFEDSDVELVQDIASLAQPVLNLLRHLQQIEENLNESKQQLKQLRQEVAQRWSLGQFETREPMFAHEVLTPLQRASRAGKIHLLFLGPTGSGKTHLAQAFHYESARREGPFITLDCSQITSAETLGAELFGYAPDSGYANAPTKGRPGKAKLADGGTLFIDEIGCLPPELQPRLLRLLQAGLFSPMGGSNEITVDLQIIAATNEDLLQRVGQRQFREDLYWRLRELEIRLPPLSHRPADIPGLASQFLKEAADRYRRPEVQELNPEAIDALVHHDWSLSGNLRGLKSTLNRAVLMSPEGSTAIERHHLRFEHTSAPQISPPPPTFVEPTLGTQSPTPPSDNPALARLLESKLEVYGGQVRGMARDPELAHALGYSDGVIPPSTLSLHLKNLGLRERAANRRSVRQPRVELDQIREAIHQYGSGTAAAEALGITRDALVWRIRKAGLTIGAILEDPEPS